MTAPGANDAQWQQWNNPKFVARFRDVEASNAPLMQELFAAIALRPGENVLDIGCGAGATTLQAGIAVGPSGHATGFDISGPMLELARERLDASELKNVTFAQGDAGSAQPPNGPFDVAISRFGVMFFSDPAAAFANIRAQIKPMGRLVFACWQSTEKNRWFPIDVLAKYSAAAPRPPEAPPAPGPFALAREEYVRDILSRAGFEGVSLAAHGYEWDAPPGPVSSMLLEALRLDDETKQKAVADLEAHQASMIRDGLLHEERNYWIVSARNP